MMKKVSGLLIAGLMIASCACTNQTEQPLPANTKGNNVLSYPESIAMQEYLADGFGKIALSPKGRGVRITREVRGDLIVVHANAIRPEWHEEYAGSPDGLESTTTYFDAKTMEIVRREIQV